MIKKIGLSRIIFFAVLGLYLSGCSFLDQPGIHDRGQIEKLVDQGVGYMREGKLDEAEAAFKVALEIGNSAAALDGMGCVAFRRGETKRAEEFFWRAYEVDATYNNSLGNLALLYESQGLRLKALELYRRSLDLDPYNFRSRNNYAVFLADGDIPKARGELLKAKALAPHSVIKDNLNALEE